MSFQNYALHRGVGVQMIRKYHEQHRLILVCRGRVDVAASDASLDDRNPVGLKSIVLDGGGANGGAQVHSDGSYSASEAARRLANLRLEDAQIEHALKIGFLVPADTGAKIMRDELRQVRDKLLAIPSIVSPRACVMRDPSVHQAFLYSEICKILEEIVALAASEAAALQAIEDRARKEREK